MIRRFFVDFRVETRDAITSCKRSREGFVRRLRSHTSTARFPHLIDVASHIRTRVLDGVITASTGAATQPRETLNIIYSVVLSVPIQTYDIFFRNMYSLLYYLYE